jgi:hypothetical protein
MKKYFLIVIIGLLTLGSCKKWLDITPKSQVASDDLFQTEEGFEEALNGVYMRCGQPDLYGGELTFGFLDVMAQNYTLSTIIDPLHYLQTQKFNFKDAYFISRKNNIWDGIYNAIVNVNLILAHIDQQKHIFTGNNYSLIKGEALALRGYLHFDIFRMFGSGPDNAGKKVGIPYVTTYSNKVTVTSSPGDVIKKVLEDLNAAKEMLEPVDPIRSSSYIVGYPGGDSSTENASPALFLQNRRNRLNYYAVCGELARVYLYEGDKTDALSNASEVIDSHKFPWTNQADFINIDPATQDRVLYKELIFGWYIPWEAQDLKNRFQSGTAGLYASPSDIQTIYETNGTGGEDLRYKEWFQVGIDGNMLFQKYKRNPNGAEDDPAANLYPLTAPALRLSEMYYIAAECSYDANPAKALDYLNEVRRHRGMGQPLNVSDKNEFINELVKEARKELYGEGQIFYMYKRLNKSITGQSGSLIPAGDNIFIIPMPNDEIEFGKR